MPLLSEARKPVSRSDKASLTCPQCGQQQLVPPTAFSSNCKKCGVYLRVQELLKPAPKAPDLTPEKKQIACFDCGAEFEVPASAQSTMCKRCSSYIDLHDYNISQAVSKNFKTKGSFVIQPSGYVFNTEAIVAEAVIKGRFLGKLVVQGCLTLHTGADIKGTMTAARLLVPPSNQVRWNGEIKVDAADIQGELVANLNARVVVVKPPGRFFGAIKAQTVIVETGAVLVGDVRIGKE
jgi:cytoskeletal protein CcmA (bactofilin family)